MNFLKILKFTISGVFFAWISAIVLFFLTAKTLSFGSITVTYQRYDDEQILGILNESLEKLEPYPEIHELFTSGRSRTRIIFANSNLLYYLLVPSQIISGRSYGTHYPFFGIQVIAKFDEDKNIIGRTGKYRSASGVVTHELVHEYTRSTFGAIRAISFKEWVYEGLADYIAQESSYGYDRGKKVLCQGLDDETASYKYFTYRVGVEYLVEKNERNVSHILQSRSNFGEIISEAKLHFCGDESTFHRS